MTFDEYSFHDKLLAGIKDMGFVEPTPVQAETFQLIAQNKDIEAQSQTGTGKTAAFLISGFQLMMTDPKYQGRKMLVIAPTRELADQIEKEAQAVGKYLGFRIGSFYGGVGYAQQEKLLSEGVDVMIGTPGRLLDFVGQGKANFAEVGVLVIDEADRLFDMGFYPDLRQMLRTMSPPEDRRTMLYSATLSPNVMNLAWEYMRDPGQIVIEPEHITVEKITQELYHVSTEEKFGVLLGVMKKENAKTVIIFTNTKHNAVRVAKRLELNGYETEYIMGDLPQAKRLKIIEDMKAGKTPVLVATDVAARGLHINGLDLVVNYDLPTEAENYVHRIGRTARAGQSGKAVSLACEKYVYGLKAIEEFANTKIPVSWFTDADAVADKSKGVYIQVDEDDRPRDRDGRGRGRDGGRGRDSSRGGPPRSGAPREHTGERPPRPEGARPESARPDGGRRDGRPDRGGRDRDKPLTIRSSPLVNEVTGMRFLKDGMETKGKQSSQADRIAAAAAAVGPKRGRGPRKEGAPAGEGGKRRDGRNGEPRGRAPEGAVAREGQAPRAERPAGDRAPGNRPPRDGHVRDGQPRDNRGRDNRGKDPRRAPQGAKGSAKPQGDRLDYYKSKYGEDFKPAASQEGSKKGPGLLGRIAGIFGLGKKDK
ncbi:MAG: DEAD/DEAH box helicase [Spirochaetales bacterium]